MGVSGFHHVRIRPQGIAGEHAQEQKSIEGIGGLKKLRELNLNGLKIKDLSPLNEYDSTPTEVILMSLTFFRLAQPERVNDTTASRVRSNLDQCFLIS